MLRYRGRTVGDEEIGFIRRLIAENPTASRRALSYKLCEAWGWVQANGAPSDMVCRGLMLALHRADHIQLPVRRQIPRNPLAERRRPSPVAVDQMPIRCRLSALQPLTLRQVRRTDEEPLFNSLVEQHHYLGYVQPVGAHLKYLVVSAEHRPVAALSLSSAARHLGPRDRYIGWSPQARRENLHSIAYNARFLILPWVEVPHLASHVLGAVARRVVDDWQQLYSHPLYFLETFVDPTRYRGTCYLAANWVVMGNTTGRGHNAPTMRQTRTLKQVLGYPLTRRFRELLSQGRR